MEQAEKLQRINIEVASNVFQFDVKPEEEQAYRIAKDILSRKLEEYEDKYRNLPRNQVLAMVAYDLTVCFVRYTQANDLSEQLDDLKKLI